MPVAKKTDDILDLSKLKDDTWLRKTFGDVSKASVAKQISVGGLTGWVAGYVSSKVGKAAATAVGGTLLLLQVAHYKGYIKVNWGRLERDWQTAQQTMDKSTEREIKNKIAEIREFARENAFLAGGFACGFLIGLAS